MTGKCNTKRCYLLPLHQRGDVCFGMHYGQNFWIRDAHRFTVVSCNLSRACARWRGGGGYKDAGLLPSKHASNAAFDGSEGP